MTITEGKCTQRVKKNPSELVQTIEKSIDTKLQLEIQYFMMP